MWQRPDESPAFRFFGAIRERLTVILPKVFTAWLSTELSDNSKMQTVTLEEAQRHLAELVRKLPREGEIVITDAAHPVARLSAASEKTSLRDLKAQSIGKVLRPFPSVEDDILGEMLGA